MQISDSTPHTPNWMQLRRTPSATATKRSTTRMCTAKPSAHKSSRRSDTPSPIPCPATMPSIRHRKKKPTTATAAPAHTSTGERFPNSSPSAGTTAQ